MANIKFTQDALDDLKELDGSERKVVLKGLAKLRTSPRDRGEPLGNSNLGDLTGFRKLVVGKKQYRVIFRVHDDESVEIAVIWVIAARTDSECYLSALKRAALQTPTQALQQSMVSQLFETWMKR